MKDIKFLSRLIFKLNYLQINNKHVRELIEESCTIYFQNDSYKWEFSEDLKTYKLETSFLRFTIYIQKLKCSPPPQVTSNDNMFLMRPSQITFKKFKTIPEEVTIHFF